MTKKATRNKPASNDLLKPFLDLSESEETFRVLINEYPLPTLLSEIPSGKILFVNRREVQLLDKDIAEVVGKTPNEVGLLKNPDDQEKLTGLIMRQGYVDNVEVEGASFDGTASTNLISMRLISVCGKTYCLTVLHDITERKMAEEALRQSEQKYRELANTVPVGIFEFDDSGKLTFVNKTLFGWFGYSDDEFTAGINILNLIDPGDRQRLKENMARIETLQASPPREYCLVRKNGEKIQVLALTKPITATGEFLGVRGILLDLTEKKKIELALQNAAKLESLGVLAGGIAHDFNNLLTGVYGFVDLARFITKEPQVNVYLEKMLDSMHRAKALTLQLLTFSKGGSPVRKITPLGPFIRETAQFALSGSNCSCRFMLPEDLRQCNIDKNQIAQVIDNIVINAQQAMPGGGTIEISAANVSFGKKGHPPLTPSDYVKISIHDSGVGIPQEIMPRIFDPFFTTKTKGHGLGLATSYSIVNRHSGCIDVDSQPGMGSTFHVYLPSSPETIVEREPATGNHKGSGVILVMDDEDVVRETFRHILERLGYTAQCINDGKEAVALYIRETTAGRRIAAMILDLTVPGGMGGMEAVVEIRKLNKELPIFVSSGYADNAVMKDPDAHGFTGSIAKPFTMADLSELLNAIV